MTLRVRRTVQIAAPPEVVFDYLADPASMQALLPQVREITAVDTLPNGGRRVTYQAADRKGAPREGVTEHLEYERPRRMVVRNELGGVTSVNERVLEPADEGTQLVASTEVSLAMPGRLASVMEWLWRRAAGRELERFLDAVRTAVEAGGSEGRTPPADGEDLSVDDSPAS